MQVVKNSFIALLVFWFAVLLFMPKQELYYALEKNLATQGIEINEKEIDEGLFSLNLMQVSIFYKGIKVATVEKINIFTLLFTSNINVKSLVLDESLKSFAPEKIEIANITHSIFSPSSVNITATGSFGESEGMVDLTNRQMRLDFTNTTKELDRIRTHLQKDEKGLYYETSF